MNNYASTIINIALEEVGYLSKKDEKFLDFKSENISELGVSGYNKYYRDLDNFGNFYSVPKNGTYWGTGFIEWCGVKAFGIAEMKKIMFHSENGADPLVMLRRYKNKERFFKKPKVGDEIFLNVKTGGVHVGLVYAIDRKRVYTIEGNSNYSNEAISNGRAVVKKSYKKNFSCIMGYGRPLYEVENSNYNIQAKYESNTETIFKFQEALCLEGYQLYKFGANGEWNKECEDVLQKIYFSKNTITEEEPHIVGFIQSQLGLKNTGFLSDNDISSIIKYKKKHKLLYNRDIDIHTLKSLIGV